MCYKIGGRDLGNEKEKLVNELQEVRVQRYTRKSFFPLVLSLQIVPFLFFYLEAMRGKHNLF
jgi:hypothetical protein